MNPIEFSEAIKQPGVYILDVRPIEDFEKAHIAGAHHLDVMASDFEDQAKTTLPKDETIAVYCNTGKRSAIAYDKLLNLGFKVINLDHGITSWIEAKLPTVS